MPLFYFLIHLGHDLGHGKDLIRPDCAARGDIRRQDHLSRKTGSQRTADLAQMITEIH